MSLDDLRPGWMRQIIAASPSRRPSQLLGCVGHFFDNEQKRAVSVDLGLVFVRCPFSFRAVSSQQDVLLTGLSWAEDTAPSEQEYLPDHVQAFFDLGCASA
jgi:hypothetical protein